jgi:hypothetical protein
MAKPELPLIEDAAAPRELREALLAARAREPGAADLTRLASSLGLALPPSLPPPLLPAAPAAGATVKLGLLAKAAAALGAVALATAIVVRSAAPPLEGPRAALPVKAMVAAPPSVASPSPAAEPELLEAPPAPAATPGAPVVRPQREAPSSARAEAPGAPSATAALEAAALPAVPPETAESDVASRLRDEALLVRSAQSMLSSDPAGALRLTAERRRRFPSGVLGQEASVVAIEALLRLGRRSEAEAQARAFEAAHPGSVHARRVRRLLEGE